MIRDIASCVIVTLFYIFLSPMPAISSDLEVKEIKKNENPFPDDHYELDNISMKFEYHEGIKPPSIDLLPKDKYGFPDWAEAVRSGVMLPVANIPGDEEKEEKIIDLLIPIKSKFNFMPNVLFPHSIHTYWLPCNVCHPKIFKAQKGGNDEMTMVKIISGQYCGRCHNKVAFPITECYRCHIKRKYKIRGNLE